MTGLLSAYRDDGPVARLVTSRLVLAGAVAGTGRGRSRGRWLIPPLVRAGEYGAIAVVAHRVGQTEQVVAPVLAGMAAWCGVLFLSESLRSWSRFARDAPRRTGIGVTTGREAI